MMATPHRPGRLSRAALTAMSLLAMAALTSQGCKASLSAQDTNPATGPSGKPPITSGKNNTPGKENNKPGPQNNTPGPSLSPDTAPQPLRRISSEQYHLILTDLYPQQLTTRLLARSIFPETIISQGFSTDADANRVSTSESNRIEDNAERLSATLLDEANSLYPLTSDCVPEGFSDAQLDGCVEALLDDKFSRAYRRPLTSQERQIARDLYESVRADQGSRVAWAALHQLLFQAPALLYRTERGEDAAPTNPELKRLTDWEMASRLSFFFLNSGPDDELWQAAQRGELKTPAQIKAQAQRLVRSPRAQHALATFHRDWLKLYQLKDANREGLMLDEQTRQALLGESGALVAHLMDQGDGNLATLLGTDELPVAASLGALYGVDGADGSVVTMPNRRGLLSTVSFMMTHSKTNSTNPIERGAFLLKDVVCAYVPPLPGGIDTQGPLKNAATLPTAKQRLAPLTERNDCSGCHLRINPPGLAMENFDHLGRFREQENDTPIDAAGTLREGGLELTFSGPNELFEGLSTSRQVHDCYARHWFRFTTGRLETDADAYTIKTLSDTFWDAQGDLSELMVELTQTEAFLYRRPHAQDAQE